MVGWKRCSLRKLSNPTESFKRDLYIYFLDLSTVWALVGRLITFGLPLNLAIYLSSQISINFGLNVIPQVPSIFFQVLLSMLAGDFVLYWLHRVFHKINFLWSLHEYHHSATEFNIITSSRDNPIVGALFVVFMFMPSALLGASVETYTWMTVLSILHAYLVHSEMRHDWGFIGKWLFVSPNAHAVHHSMSPQHWDKNFGFLSPIWDHIFGSYYDGKLSVDRIGTIEKYYNNNSLPNEILWGILGALKKIKEKIIRKKQKPLRSICKTFPLDREV